ncbi:thiamine-phosphate kinase [Glaciimonas soli]|uniref:Thiamine-monophosphate kinase n=1 Tax=Glaciimonas soli TaxID=2590999 RepID=A0A843YRV0_9BURK|nr:thiamine-phosphate kinase [Glaciimonas soli]MQR02479.1 thiamine-phosphate kinase [Glaciimonas soli]
MLSEFDLIAQYFTRPPRANGQVALGVGDDCALLTPTAGMQLAISSDMLVSGRHFFADVDPYTLGHKSLAVNLSDLAAMGARPLGFTLALALPEARAEWLAPFAKGLLALADLHHCELIGGDTTKGPLNICITIFGETAPGQALRRDAAKIGDDIWVSGTLGDARLALAGYRLNACKNDPDEPLGGQINLDASNHALAAARMHQPTPRVALGLALRGIAHAAIDISDGLIGDLGHILQRSGVGAKLSVDDLPLGAVLAQQPQTIQRHFALAGGDDYELCFTAAAAQREAVLTAAQNASTKVTRIGSIVADPGIAFVAADGTALDLQLSSFDHFRTT